MITRCLLVIPALLLASCSSQKPDDDETWKDIHASVQANVRAAENKKAKPSEPVAPASSWQYREEKDELRGKAAYYASNTSQNEVQFNFPYGGGSSLTLQIRKSPAYGSDVIFHIDRGQFVCGIYDCAGMISFDGKPEKLSLTTPADHSSNTLFATYGPALIRKLKAADKVIVELPFYQEGNRQFTFDTSGLDWAH